MLDRFVLPVEFMHHGRLSVAPHDHLLLLKLLSHLGHTQHYNLIKGKCLHCFNALKTNSMTLTSLAEDPETSIQVLEKKAQDPSMKTM